MSPGQSPPPVSMPNPHRAQSYVLGARECYAAVGFASRDRSRREPLGLGSGGGSCGARRGPRLPSATTCAGSPPTPSTTRCSRAPPPGRRDRRSAPPTGRSCTPRCSARSRRSDASCSPTAGPRTSRYWIYVIRELTARGLRVVAYDLRGHGQQRAGGQRRLLDRAVRRGPRGGARGVRAGGPARGGRRPLARRDVDRRLGRAPRRGRARVGARGAAQHRRRRSDRRAAAGRPCPPFAKRSTRRSRSAASSGPAAPLPPFSTPLSHAAIRYVAFGPSATPAQVAFYERMLTACPPDARADVGHRDVRGWSSTTRCRG